MRVKHRGAKNLKQSDFVIIAMVTILVIFGVVMVFSASYYKSINDSGSPYSYLIKQGVFALTGFVIMGVCARLDYHIFRRLSILILGVSLLLLLLVLTPLGVEEGGATRALYIGFTIMPGEIAKIAVIIFTASYLASDPRIILSFSRGVLPLLLLMGVFGGLIIKQPNLSTAITVCGIIAGIMFLAGLQWKYVIGAMIAGGGGIFGLIMIGDKIGAEHWSKRFTSFLDPFADALGDGFQVVQSLLALGSGGLFGLGLGKSIQKNLYLPEPQNDFILAIIGEELGFIGLLALIVVYVVLIWRCFHVCLNAPDRFGMLLSGGITIMIGLQVILNIAVVTSSMPPTGIALPFVSYGGNALWIFMASAGMVLNISRQSGGSAPAERKPEKRR
ncbi:FtsW/RodA/SpoVE family cell cycle protein [Ihubacter sp. mB4P-1]|uniref:FtsW/RodA/SpoVE family cell cycle protein n=1 Tax=Ihubacter sp. mB4P-1 TaxID=3242370 RepID=UPI003C7EC9DD